MGQNIATSKSAHVRSFQKVRATHCHVWPKFSIWPTQLNLVTCQSQALRLKGHLHRSPTTIVARTLAKTSWSGCSLSPPILYAIYILAEDHSKLQLLNGTFCNTQEGVWRKLDVLLEQSFCINFSQRWQLGN